MTTEDRWNNAYYRARKIVGEMTIAEKTNLTTGTGWMSEACVGTTGSVPRLGIPQICLQDGPLGVRFTDFASSFSSALAVGSSFNKDLMSLRGSAVAHEHKNKGVHIMLGPAMGPLGRQPAGGRIWEGFGSDPYLQGVGARLTIRSIQEAGLVATAKHFLLNEQEFFRQVREFKEYGFTDMEEAISSDIDDRTLHEVYLWPFADSVNEGVGAVMCSYQRVNGTYACENSWLMNKLLKEELGFQGFVMSDWWAQHSGPKAALAGNDMIMPGESIYEGNETWWGKNLVKDVLAGDVSDWRLNDMTVRILAACLYVGLDHNTIGGPNFSAWTQDTTGYLHFSSGPQGVVNKHVDVMNNPLSKKASMQAATEAIVLLKNVNNTLPFSNVRKLNLFGLAAGPDPAGANCEANLGCSNGALGSGWGSGAVRFPYFVSPFEGISQLAREKGVNVDYDFAAFSCSGVTAKAAYSDANIIFGMSDSGEAFLNIDGNMGDCKNFSLWHNADEVIC